MIGKKLFKRLEGWMCCRIGYHDFEYYNKEGYLTGIGGPKKCRRCDLLYEGIKIPPCPPRPKNPFSMWNECSCPQCGDSLIEPRGSGKYCENCGYPAENRCDEDLPLTLDWSIGAPLDCGEYWNWNGDTDSRPVMVYVGSSGDERTTWVQSGQLGRKDSILSKDFGGYWAAAHWPLPLPNGALKHGDHEQSDSRN